MVDAHPYVGHVTGIRNITSEPPVCVVFAGVLNVVAQI
jgi:hypothetical protein